MDIRELAGRQIDEYQLINMLGQGGMSAVYRGYQEELDRYVAVKILSDELAQDATYITRFKQEAKISASLEHPNIVPVYDYGVQDGLSFVAMRLLNTTLTDRLHSGQRMSLNEIITVIEGVARALDYAHSRGIVHRDVKPSNIMYDESGTPYLVDFGIAKAIQMEQHLTGEQQVLGTPSYMAPEQWRDDALTPATDQYALAVVVFQMLAGTLPFTADSPSQLMYKHLQEAPPSVTEFNAGLTTSVAEVLRRGMAKDANQRYPRIINFSNALKQALLTPAATDTQEHQAVAAAPVRPPAQPAAVRPPVPPVRRPPTGPAPRPQPTPAEKSALLQIASGGMIGIAVILVIAVILIIIALVVMQPKPASPAESIPSAEAASTQEAEIASTSAPTALISSRSGVPTPDITFSGMNAATLRQASLLFSEGNIPVRDAVYSPAGTMIASAHGDGLVRLWRDGVSGSPTVLSAHTDVASALTFSADGSLLASGGRDNTVYVWNTAGGERVAGLQGHTSGIRDLAFSPDGLVLASAAEDGTVRLWNVSTWQVIRTLPADSARVLAVAFSPDGSHIAAGGWDRNVRIYNAGSGILETELRGHTEELRSIAFSPDGTIIASSSTDNRIIVWRAEDGSILHNLDGQRDIFVVTFNPDGTLLASGGRDNHIRIWDTASGSQLADLGQHSGWILGLAFSPNGANLLSGSGDGSVRLWSSP